MTVSMTVAVIMFAAGLLTGLVVGALVASSLHTPPPDRPEPVPFELSRAQRRDLTHIRSELMGLHMEMLADEDKDTLPDLNPLQP